MEREMEIVYKYVDESFESIDRRIREAMDKHLDLGYYCSGIYKDPIFKTYPINPDWECSYRLFFEKHEE